MADRAGDDADGQPGDAHRWRQEHRGADDREVVDERRERRRTEAVARVQDAGRDRPGGEEQRREDHDPRQLDGRRDRRRAEPLGDGWDEDVGEHEDDRGQDGEDREHQGEDRRHHPPRPLLLVGREEGRDDRHEGRAQGTGGDELEQEVRDAERGEERVELGDVRDRAVDEHVAQVAKDAAGDDRRGDDRAGPRQRPRGGLPGPGTRDADGARRPQHRPARVGIARGDRVDAVLAHEERARGCASR